MFQYQALQKLSERGSVPPETLSKYADIDQHLRRLELKLREGTTREVGQRGHNRVSQMAQQFLDRADRAPPHKVRPPPQAPSGPRIALPRKHVNWRLV